MTVGELIKILEGTDKDRVILIEDNKYITEIIDTADVKCERVEGDSLTALYDYETEGALGDVSEYFQENGRDAFLLVAGSLGIRG